VISLLAFGVWRLAFDFWLLACGIFTFDFWEKQQANNDYEIIKERKQKEIYPVATSTTVLP
jgi:hypothetical protein